MLAEQSRFHRRGVGGEPELTIPKLKHPCNTRRNRGSTPHAPRLHRPRVGGAKTNQLTRRHRQPNALHRPPRRWKPRLASYIRVGGSRDWPATSASVEAATGQLRLKPGPLQRAHLMHIMLLTLLFGVRPLPEECRKRDSPPWEPSSSRRQPRLGSVGRHASSHLRDNDFSGV